MKYIKTFEQHSQYTTYIGGDNVKLPNVSYCIDNDEVHYHPTVHDYRNDYLTFEALESGEICFNIWKSMGTDMITSISYSTDGGETWTTTQNVNNKSENLQISVNVEEGDKVLWKGIATQTGYFDEDWGATIGSFFSSDCEYNAYGNVMSLLHGDDFYGVTSLGNTENTFGCLFFDYNWVESCQIVSAQNLILPATTLAEDCYRNMFYGCTSLTTAPALPATTLTTSCYGAMFYGCTSLTTAPELPATTLAQSCYYEMFYNCTSLTTVPKLPATTLAHSCYFEMFGYCKNLITVPSDLLPVTTLANNCYNKMFSGCTSLTTAPELPATTLAESCYYEMFYRCTSLATAPELPATTLARSCYRGMFNGCTSLTTAPELNATTLAQYCYNSMFQGCTSLTTAPVLPATTLVSSCYDFMFQNCTNLNYIKAMFTTTPGEYNGSKSWVKNVAATGTFVKNSAAQWNVTGNHGIPSGWTVQTASE